VVRITFLYRSVPDKPRAVQRFCRQADLQQLWGPIFRGCRPKAANSLPAGLRQTEIGYEQFKDKFSNANTSHGNVATHLRCGKIFSNCRIVIFPLNVSTKEF